MISRLCVILLAGLAAPALAQSINPAIEADGSQTQTLEVLGGTVSVSIESAGSLALGRDEPQAGASATLSVNDLSVGLGSRGGQNDDAAPVDAGHVVIPSSAAGEVVSVSGTVQNDNCAFAATDAAEVETAIAAGVPVIIRDSDCARPDPGIGQIIDNAPGLGEVLDHAGTVRNRVVAITTADEGVIVYQSSQP